jgi:hypothetical protein
MKSIVISTIAALIGLGAMASLVQSCSSRESDSGGGNGAAPISTPVATPRATPATNATPLPTVETAIPTPAGDIGETGSQVLFQTMKQVLLGEPKTSDGIRGSYGELFGSKSENPDSDFLRLYYGYDYQSLSPIRQDFSPVITLTDFATVGPAGPNQFLVDFLAKQVGDADAELMEKIPIVEDTGDDPHSTIFIRFKFTLGRENDRVVIAKDEFVNIRR